MSIKNEDLRILCDIEALLHKKIKQSNKKEYELWLEYWNMVERFCQEKDLSRRKSNNYNKNNAEYHRLNNNLYQARKRNNKEKIELYIKKIEEYKKAKRINKAKEVIISEY